MEIKGFREAKLTERTNVYSIRIVDSETGEIKDSIRLIKKKKEKLD